jgi:electron transfer flavoprotein beta subunit
VIFTPKRKNKIVHMKILVCISSVPDTTSKLTLQQINLRQKRNSVGNQSSEFALTKAVKLQESQGATVTVINVGDAATEPVIRKALAIGANDAVRVNLDPKIASLQQKKLLLLLKTEDMIYPLR